jgi:hypothetical protein
MRKLPVLFISTKKQVSKMDYSTLEELSSSSPKHLKRRQSLSQFEQNLGIHIMRRASSATAAPASGTATPARKSTIAEVLVLGVEDVQIKPRSIGDRFKTIFQTRKMN